MNDFISYVDIFHNVIISSILPANMLMPALRKKTQIIYHSLFFNTS